MRTIDPSTPSSHFSNLIKDFPRRHCSLLFQLRTGHAPLNKHLHCISKSPTAQCLQCNEHEGTVKHFLLVCLCYAQQCAALCQEAGTGMSQLCQLLNNEDFIKPLFCYIARTRRLEQMFGDVSPSKPQMSQQT
ncbi:hypothetical protein CY34DRAFT_83463 [Suillus luteus UH-Slu-Lm8-n1]|uniref:Reverse transcriptase zinc-binding domain-containing protein n=1 Tax=Suillus luteus UH-Slu-Lm8-n1 TaxID=930992 RepID=A0A0D0AKY3_9AGAM|nr:hypothetical protein CY34DRAFT_83463 [Suillus luteus UH-Slu-Lm8-n1]